MKLPENQGNTHRITLPEGYNEIVSYCGSVDFSSRQDGSLALIRSFLCFTIPRSGIAHDWLSFKDIDTYPELRLPVYEFKAKHDTRAHQTGFGADFGVRIFEKPSKEMDPIRDAVYLSEVKEHIAARRYVEELVDSQEGRPLHMRMQPVDKFSEALFLRETNEYTLNQFSQPPNFKKIFQTLTPDDAETVIESIAQSRYLDSNWHILGRSGPITKIVQDADSDFDDYGEFIQRKVRELATRTKARSDVFAVEGYSPLSYSSLWMLHYYIWRENRAIKDPTTAEETLGVLCKETLTAFAKRFGTQLWIYSQDESIMQIDTQVFESPGQLFPDAVKMFGEKIFRDGRGQ